MAEEIIKLSTPPESAKLNGAVSRRKLAGNASTSNSGSKKVPHYLRASTGSCHDHCKYGTEHTFKTNAKRPLRKKIAKTDGGNEVEIVVLVERKRPVSDKVKSISETKTAMSESIKLNKQVKKPASDSKTVLGDSKNFIRQEVSSPSVNLDASFQQVASTSKERKLSVKTPNFVQLKPTKAGSNVRINGNVKKKIESDVLVKQGISSKPKSVTVNPSASANANGGSSRSRDNNIQTGKKVPTHLKPSLSSKPSIKKIAGSVAEKTKSLKIVPLLDNRKKVKSVELKKSVDEKVQEKILYVIDIETKNKTLLSNEKNNLASVETIIPDKKNNSVSVETTIPDSGKETLESAKNGSPTNQSTPSSSLMSPKSTCSPISPYSISHEVDNHGEESEYTSSEADNETVDIRQLETMQGELKMRQKKSGMVLSEDKDDNPVKLSFRRGKIIDLQSENNGARRLKFRQRRTLVETESINDNAWRRHFKKRQEVDGNEAKLDSEKVVLRHQDVHGKKDTRGLLNNVIEETASKLVETRRSKVKALVGAFETVISLQDCKPSPNTVSLS